MKFLFAMLACLTMGLGFWELGHTTSVHVISQVGLGFIVVAAFGVFIDGALSNWEMIKINAIREGV